MASPMQSKFPIKYDRSVGDRPDQPAYLPARATPEQYGAGAGEMASRVGQHLTEIAINEKAKADAFAAADLDAQFSQEATKILYNQQDGFMTKTGAAALDAAPVAQQLVDLREKIGAKAASGEQAQAFMARTADRANMLYQAIEQHSTSQRQVYFKQTADGQFANAVEQASLLRDTEIEDPANPGKKVKAVDHIIEHVRPLLLLQWASNENLPPEEIQRRWVAARQTLLGEVAKAYIAKDQGVKGLKFINDYRADLGSAAIPLEATLRPIADKEIGSVLGENVYQASFGMGPGGQQADPDRPGEVWQQAELRRQATEKGLTLTQFEAALNTLRTRNADFNAGYGRDTDQIFTSATNVWEQANHNLHAIPGNMQVELQKRGEWHKLELMNKAWWDAQISSENRGPTPEQRFESAKFMWNLLHSPHVYDNWTPEKFRREVGYKMHPSDMEQNLINMGRQQTRPERWTAPLATVMNRAMEMAAQQDVIHKLRDPDPKKRDPQTGNWDQEDIYVFYEINKRVQQWVMNDWNFSHDPKNPLPTDKEMLPFLETLFAKGRDPDGGFFGSKTFNVRAQALGTGFEPDKDLPHEVGMQIDEGLRTWDQTHPGQPKPSKDALVRAWFEEQRSAGSPKTQEKAQRAKDIKDAGFDALTEIGR